MPVPVKDPFADLEATVFQELAVSAYLPAQPGSAYSAHHHPLAFRELAHRERSYLADEEIVALDREAPAVIERLEAMGAPPTVPIAVFACTPRRLMKLWRLAGDVEAELRVARRIHTAPVRRLLFARPPALVLAADKERAHLFLSLLGEVDELAEVVGRPIKRQHQGGWSATAFERREDLHAERNLGRGAEWIRPETWAFVKQLYLAGPPETLAALTHRLPESARSRLHGELRLPLYKTPGELKEALRELLAATAAPDDSTG